MKKFFLTILIFLLSLSIGCSFLSYIEVNEDVNNVFKVNTTDVDFTQFFTIHDFNEENVEVTEDMLNLSRVDFSKPGKFYVTINYKDLTAAVEIIVVDEESTNDINFDPNTVSKDRLQDVLMDYDGAIGLPSTGTYSCLVVPIQFKDTKITSKDIERLNSAFNGNDTGWESVASYYRKSSYGKLNLSFDITDVYISSKNSSYYDRYEKVLEDSNGDYYYQTGDEALMLEVMAYLEPRMDLSKYDVNNDGTIDAVYLIYSADVEYNDEQSIYWAFVSYYLSTEEHNKKFDDLDVYYYLFAGLDFMDEDIDTWFSTNPNFKTNASTYIHETGHLLGIDDYYDYYPDEGSDKTVGCADMMDYTVGDHNCYSKLMMGWVEPIVITKDQTISLKSFENSGEFIMLLLDYNGTYFSEYLLIDFYTATGLNEMHSKLNDTYMYGGAKYGVRIYHVDSNIDNPFSDDYQSITTNNNSISKFPLLKLIEADGENNFDSTYGEAKEQDLWKSGTKFSDVYPMYLSYDYKLLSFDIIIGNVDQNGATITIDYK